VDLLVQVSQNKETACFTAGERRQPQNEDTNEPEKYALNSIHRLSNPKPDSPKRGSAEGLLTCAGTWVFDDGEREMLEKEIQAIREVVDA
jgi:hypothetical protein